MIPNHVGPSNPRVYATAWSWWEHPRYTAPENPVASAVAVTPQALPEWMGRGLCASTVAVDGLFFADNPGDLWQAQRVCFRCPVLDTCRDYALTQVANGQDLHGVWGGTTRHGRQVLLREVTA